MTFHKFDSVRFVLSSTLPPSECFGFLVVFIQLKCEMNERRKNNYGSSASSLWSLMSIQGMFQSKSVLWCLFFDCWCWTWASKVVPFLNLNHDKKVENQFYRFPLASLAFSHISETHNADRHRIIMVSFGTFFFVLIAWTCVVGLFFLAVNKCEHFDLRKKNATRQNVIKYSKCDWCISVWCKNEIENEIHRRTHVYNVDGTNRKIMRLDWMHSKWSHTKIVNCGHLQNATFNRTQTTKMAMQLALFFSYLAYQNHTALHPIFCVLLCFLFTSPLLCHFNLCRRCRFRI